MLASNRLFAQQAKIARDLQHLPSGQGGNGIVQYAVPPTQRYLSMAVANGGSLVIGPESDPSFGFQQLAFPKFVDAAGDIGRGDRI